MCFLDRFREESKEERKRKRRSRWGDPDNNISIPTVNDIPGQLNQPGIVLPTQVGQNSVIIPAVKVPQPKGKNPMLTTISRTDPALIQYARQTYGTLDLSEEQWKKAEDHFKVLEFLRILVLI